MDETMNEQFSGKTYLVTGATSGIGLAIAAELVSKGASVMGVGRSAERCAAAQRHLRTIDPQARIDYLCADLSLQSQVRRLAECIGETLASQGKKHLDGLVNNAGTFTYWQILSPEGFETQWAVNHLAPFLLTNALLPLLQAAPAAKIVTVSSDSHYSARLDWNDIQLRRHYNGLRAYEQSKLANVLFTLELNRRLGQDSTVRAYAADPGLVKTDIGFKGAAWGPVRWIWSLRRAGGVSPEKSAQGIVLLLDEEVTADSTAVYWKDGKPKQPGRLALDARSASRLWVLSEQMCRIQTTANQEN
jgi:NAD(P)-dependent dehydrogenase (short-subunit alcohol dehydrogenase family)